MKINLLFIGLISFLMTSFQVKSEAQEFGDYYLKNRLLNTKSFTIEVIEAMPETEYMYKPANDVRTFTALASHVLYSIEWNIALMKNKPIKWQPGDENRFSRQQLVEYANNEFNNLIEFVASAKASPELTEKIVDVLNHNAHHRGQMITYLRIKGITPPEYR
ncbi:DinB family protein [Seonamhaeicola maritimus]|uniref:DinB family protein n=1 Tax=Seonamhaeicola maritimus TaxID=2591822 RepID=UPI0024943E6E|nr:DinB family protein [Seonamhaeicola maritimus]